MTAFHIALSSNEVQQWHRVFQGRRCSNLLKYRVCKAWYVDSPYSMLIIADKYLALLVFQPFVAFSMLEKIFAHSVSLSEHLYKVHDSRYNVFLTNVIYMVTKSFIQVKPQHVKKGTTVAGEPTSYLSWDPILPQHYSDHPIFYDILRWWICGRLRYVTVSTDGDSRSTGFAQISGCSCLWCCHLISIHFDLIHVGIKFVVNSNSVNGSDLVKEIHFKQHL